MMILLWRVLGFRLSIKKGAFGQLVNWVGLEFRATGDHVQATISQDKVEKAANTAEKLIDQHLIYRTGLIWKSGSRMDGEPFYRKIGLRKEERSAWERLKSQQGRAR